MHRGRSKSLAALLLFAVASCRNAATRFEPRQVDIASQPGVHIDAIDVDVDLIRIHLTVPATVLKAFLLSSQTDGCHDGVSGMVWNRQPARSAVVSFAPERVESELRSGAFLAVKLQGAKHETRCVKVPLALATQALQGAAYGLGHAVRFKSGAVNPSLGVDRWFGETRLRLSVESGIAACDWLAEGRPGCLGRVPLAAGLDASRALLEGKHLTLGASVGYDVGIVDVVEGRGADVQDEPWVHGPRVALLLYWSRKRAAWFSTVPANDIQALEFGAQLYQRRWFDDITITPTIGWLWTVPF